MGTPASQTVESMREALIALESLREHALRVLMDWAVYLKEKANKPLLRRITSTTQALMQLLEPQKITAYQANKVVLPIEAQKLWTRYATDLSTFLFADSAQNWRDCSLCEWIEQQQTQPARFLAWLGEKNWKDAGQSSVSPLPFISDQALQQRLLKEQYSFIAQPEWQGQTYELSWFNQHDLADNGLYSRTLGRLFEIMDLILTLDAFFLENKKLPIAYPIAATGLAHTHAARGRLTHCVEMDGSRVKQLLILAPTEWNFHPQGVAVKSLENLQADYPDELRQQAELLIHAIDPCVGYSLNLEYKRLPT
jgi:hypothetical protein